MPGRQLAPAAAGEYRVHNNQTPAFKNADLIRQYVHLYHPPGGRVGHAVGIAIDAHHAITTDTPFHTEHRIEWCPGQVPERRALFCKGL